MRKKLHIKKAECAILIDKIQKSYFIQKKKFKVRLIVSVSIIAILVVIAVVLIVKYEPPKYDTIDEALINYDFDEARKIYADYKDEFFTLNYNANSKLRQIIKAEVSYYTDNNLTDKALASLNEYYFQWEFQNKGQVDSQNSNYNEETSWFNGVLEIIINKLIASSDFDKASEIIENYAKKTAKKVNSTNSWDGESTWTLDNSWLSQKRLIIEQNQSN